MELRPLIDHAWTMVADPGNEALLVPSAAVAAVLAGAQVSCTPAAPAAGRRPPG